MTDTHQPDLETRAEIERLKSSLDLSAETLCELEKLGAGAIHQLRHSITEQVFGYKREGFESLAGLVRFLPAGYLAKLAVSAFGARLCGRLVSCMNPISAAAIAKRLPPEFLADASAHADPRRVREVIRLLPAAVVRDSTLVLVKRQAYGVMARFADALSPSAIRAIVKAVDDDETLLKIAFLMEDKSQISKMIQMIDNDRIARIVRTGTDKALWPAALAIIDGVEGELRSRLANIMGQQDSATLDGLVLVAHEQGLWPPVLRGMAAMSSKHYRKIVNLPSVQKPQLLQGLIQCAYDENLLEATLPLVSYMRADHQKLVAKLVLEQGDEIADATLWAANNSGHWRVILELAQYLEDSERNVLARMSIFRKKAPLKALLESAAESGQMLLLLDYAKRLDADGLRLMVQIALENSGDLLESMLSAARKDPEGWKVVVTAVAAVEKKEHFSQLREVFARQTREDQQAFRNSAEGLGFWERVAPALGAA